MHRSNFATTAVLAFCLQTAPLDAQVRSVESLANSAESKPVTEESINSPPKREINFERLDEAMIAQFGERPDPKLLELKWAAVVVIEGRSLSLPSLRSGGNLGSATPYWRAILSGNPRVYGGDVSLSEAFREAIEQIPAAERPAEDVIAFFTSPDLTEKNSFTVKQRSRPGRGSSPFAPSPYGRGDAPVYDIHFTILAETPEKAESRAAGFLKIVDWGVFRPWAQEYWKQRKIQVEEASEAQKLVDAGNETLARFGDPKQFSGSPETLGPLRTQLVIERAGLAARIAAYDKLIANKELSRERRERLEDEKLSAEVQLIDVDTRIELIRGILSQTSVRNSFANAKGRLNSTEAALQALLPPPLVDGKITIQPLKWQ